MQCRAVRNGSKPLASWDAVSNWSVPGEKQWRKITSVASKLHSLAIMLQV